MEKIELMHMRIRGKDYYLSPLRTAQIANMLEDGIINHEGSLKLTKYYMDLGRKEWLNRNGRKVE